MSVALSVTLSVINLVAIVAWFVFERNTWRRFVALAVVAVVTIIRFANDPASTLSAFAAGWFVCAVIDEALSKFRHETHVLEVEQAWRDGARQEAYRYLAHLARIKRNRQGGS